MKNAVPNWLEETIGNLQYFRQMEMEHRRLMASIKLFTEPFEEARKAAQQIADMHRQSMSALASLSAIRHINEFLKPFTIDLGLPTAAKFDPAVTFDIDLSRFRHSEDTTEQKRLEKVKNKRPIGFVANPRKVDR